MSDSLSETSEVEVAGGRASMIERMTKIVAAFDRPGLALAGSAISTRAGLPRSTTHRIVDEMIRYGWLRRTDAGFVLAALAPADVAPTDSFRLRVAAAPLLQALHEETGLIAHLMVPDGPQVLVLDKVGGRSGRTWPIQVGTRLPAYATAAGKALLAGMDAEDIDLLLPEVLEKRTAWTTRNRADLYFDLHRIRRRKGIAMSGQEAIAGIHCIAVAFEDGEGGRGALTLSAGAGFARLERFGPLLVESARRTRTRMFDEGHGVARKAGGQSAKRVPDALMLRLLNSIKGDDWV